MKGTGCFGAGSALLVLIFSILCLTVSTLMTLSSANSDKAMTKKLGESVLSYYSTDGKAVETAVAFRNSILNGDIPTKIGGITITSEENGVFTYSCPIDDARTICVSLKEKNGTLLILSWLETHTNAWAPDEALQVWTGENLP